MVNHHTEESLDKILGEENFGVEVKGTLEITIGLVKIGIKINSFRVISGHIKEVIVGKGQIQGPVAKKE